MVRDRKISSRSTSQTFRRRKCTGRNIRRRCSESSRENDRFFKETGAKLPDSVHATSAQRYPLRAIEDNGGLSALRGTLSWLDMSPVASGIQAAISSSCQPTLEPTLGFSPFVPLATFYALRGRRSNKKRRDKKRAFVCPGLHPPRTNDKHRPPSLSSTT